MKTLKLLSRAIDKLNEYLGKFFGIVLIIPLISATVYDVILRYFFGASTIWAYDLTWMVYAAFFLIGAPYTLLKGGHVRVDIFFSRLSKKNQALLDAIFMLFFFFPLIIVILRFSIPWAWSATLSQERALNTIWRPYTYPIKLMLPISFILLGLQGVSNLIKDLIFYWKGEQL